MTNTNSLREAKEQVITTFAGVDVKKLTSKDIEAITQHTQEAVERARVETAKHIILNCKERNYSDITELPMSYTEYISHNKIMDYIVTLTQTKEEK